MNLIKMLFNDLLYIENVALPIENLHYLCRSGDSRYPVPYPCDKKSGEVIIRPYVPNHYVPWSNIWYEYNPVEYTASRVLSNPSWADPKDPTEIKFNEPGGLFDRKSNVGSYEIESNGRPLNPIGRTGITGRGRLGKWGPNHAADCIITRWKKDEEDIMRLSPLTGKRILEFIAINRASSGEWAIPGGMCEPGESQLDASIREFFEEALNSLKESENNKKSMEQNLKEFFESGINVYSGYVDDPRNTDNAWMETVAFNFHDDSNKLKDLKLHAGDDAGNVKWTEINNKLRLYACHRDFIEICAKMHDAHWSDDY